MKVVRAALERYGLLLGPPDILDGRYVTSGAVDTRDGRGNVGLHFHAYQVEKGIPVYGATLLLLADARWSLDVGELAKQGVKIPIWLAFHLAGFGDAGKELGLNPDLANILEREVREHHLNQLASMEQFEATFKEAITSIRGEEGRLGQSRLENGGCWGCGGRP